MPRLRKTALTHFIRTECYRQLRLNLSRMPERIAEAMPTKQPRPGFPHAAEEGNAWQAAKVQDLCESFGEGTVLGKRRKDASSKQIVYDKIDLGETLEQAPVGSFLIEAEFDVGNTFESALDIADYRSRYNLSYSGLRPDIIEVAPVGDFDRFVSPDGAVKWLPDNDKRAQLRVIDIKMAAEPSPDHFAEITLYSMALAGWLVDHGLENQYVVVPDAAIWPGSHDVSTLVKMSRDVSLDGRLQTAVELKGAMKKDLEPEPFEVFASRIRQFLRDDIAYVLDPSRPWESLSWHIDTRCKSCDYVGYLNWKNKEGEFTWDPKHCIPLAEQNDHLCQVAFLSRGARAALEAGKSPIKDVSTLAGISPVDPRLDVNHTLRASKYVVCERATALIERQAFIAQQSGTSCMMPRWADLRIYISVNFDIGSGITFAMGLSAFWAEPWSETVTKRRRNQWPARTFIIGQRDPLVEQSQLISLLNGINEILSYAYDLHKDTKVQLYMWDSIQYKHLTRIVGRHLPAILENPAISHLAWLFPPEELEPNPKMETRRSPITVLKGIIQSLLAAPVPYYYTLFSVARVYHDDSFNPQQLKVHPLFEDQLSAQIPSERAHDVWAQNEYSHERRSILESTVLIQLKALETVRRRLEDDLRPSLHQVAPKIKIGPPDHYYSISSDGQLWLTFALLDSALGELEVHQARAMPPHEREARFKSARLVRRITGEEEAQKLNELGIPPRPGRRVYEMRHTSREVKLREGDFDFALSPGEDAGFLDIKVPRKTESTPLPKDSFWWQKRMEDVTAVTVTRIDRDAGIIVLDADARYPSWLDDLEAYNVADFSRDVTLDRRWTDKFTKKLEKTLKEIRNPSNAEEHHLVQRAVSGEKRYRTRITERHPAGDILWSAWEIAQPRIERELREVRCMLEDSDIRLNRSQWKAWELALTHRVQLIWGPPGTGKSRTLQAVALGALLDASLQGLPTRILVCAPTYNALDNVLFDVNSKIKDVLPDARICVKRLRSKYRKADERFRDIDLELNVANPTREVQELRQRLIDNSGITLIGTTPQQVHNLLVLNNNPPMAPLFDTILLDEASQMDVANAILPIASIGDEGSLIIAGDPQQLPPIHKAHPPAGLECMVGSIFNYFKQRHKLREHALKMNYRSNQTIVDFAYEAGYPRSLKSYSPNLCMNLVKELPSKSAPADWPSTLWWTPHWATLLDPNRPATCFIYEEGMSGQWNQFEADTVAALILSLFRRLGKQPSYERDPRTRAIIPPDQTVYQDAEFWERGVGIVTPHRAQQALIISRLQKIFSPLGVSNALIRDAVDTVERFQGQQRDVIIASYALGDQDLIRDEDEFLMSLNRFNVMVSRARTKIITLVSQEVINHLSLDVDILWESRLLKLFADSFCSRAELMTLKYYDEKEGEQTREGTYKYLGNRSC